MSLTSSLEHIDCLTYGGGDWKLGWTLGARGSEKEVAKQGKQYRANLMSSLPALSKLTSAIKKKLKTNGSYIRGIAGHPLYCRSPHSSLNTLLQSAGAQVAKVWYVCFHEAMEDIGYVYGEDYETYGFFHDEIQVGSRPEIADTVGEILCQQAERAGEVLGFRLPTEAEYKIGFNWADTH